MRSLVRLALLAIAVTLTSSCGNGTGLFETLSVATAVTPGNVALGDTVRIHVTVTDLSNQQVSPSCLAYFRVVASDGSVVGGSQHWGCVYTSGWQFDSHSFDFEWVANVWEGTYRVIGEAQSQLGYVESKPAELKVYCAVCVGPAR